VKGNVLGWSIGGVLLLIYLVFAFWFMDAGNFSDGTVSGRYALRLSGETSILILKQDHTFQQELDRAGTVRLAQGSWRVSGEGHIAFSKQFLRVSGQEISPAGQAYGQIENRFGLLSITLAPNPNGPTFHKKLFGRV
jgi:hypothetical protein